MLYALWLRVLYAHGKMCGFAVTRVACCFVSRVMARVAAAIYILSLEVVVAKAPCFSYDEGSFELNQCNGILIGTRNERWSEV